MPRAVRRPRPEAEFFEHRFERLLADVSARLVSLPATRANDACRQELHEVLKKTERA